MDFDRRVHRTAPFGCSRIPQWINSRRFWSGQFFEPAKRMVKDFIDGRGIARRYRIRRAACLERRHGRGELSLPDQARLDEKRAERAQVQMEQHRLRGECADGGDQISDEFALCCIHELHSTIDSEAGPPAPTHETYSRGCWPTRVARR
jgi:hypothetical protein